MTRQTFVGKVMHLLSNMLSRLVIAFLPRSKCLLISWLQSTSALILAPPKIKSVTISIVSPSICHEVMEPDVHPVVGHGIQWLSSEESSESETQVRSLGWKDALEKEMATHSSILAWKSLMGYSPWSLNGQT